MTGQSRVARGVPTGGQFAAHARTDAEATLAPRVSERDTPVNRGRFSTDGGELDRLSRQASPQVVFEVARNRFALPETLRRIATQSTASSVTRSSVASNPSADEVTVNELAQDVHPAVRFSARQNAKYRPVTAFGRLGVALERFVYRPVSHR